MAGFIVSGIQRGRKVMIYSKTFAKQVAIVVLNFSEEEQEFERPMEDGLRMGS